MIRNAGLMILSVVIALFVAEGTLRLLDLYDPFPYPPVPRWTEQFGPHPAYGYALHPGQTTTFDYPPAAPRTTTIHANSDGFRQVRELDEVDDRTRLLVVGDSYVYGIGVEEDERFTDLVEAAIPRLRLDNLGIPGWGPDMMLLATEAVVARTQPDLVVVSLFFDDFRRVRRRYSGLGFSIPRFELDADTLVLRPYPKPRPWERTHLNEAASRALYGENRIRSAPSATEWTINERILDRFRALGDENGFETVLLYLPGRWSGGGNDRRRGWVRQYATRYAVPMLDLTETVHSDSAAAFLPDNGHYSRRGHALVASRLTAFLDSLTAP